MLLSCVRVSEWGICRAAQCAHHISGTNVAAAQHETFRCFVFMKLPLTPLCVQ